MPKKTFGEPKGNVKCYTYIFGFEKPCWHYAGYVCPIKEGQNRGEQNKIYTLTLSVKIDCSLVKNYLTNRYIKAITDGVISFAKNADLKTIGECIETREQMEALKEAGLNYGQGWFFYKPMPLEEAIKLSS